MHNFTVNLEGKKRTLNPKHVFLTVNMLATSFVQHTTYMASDRMRKKIQDYAEIFGHTPDYAEI